MWTRGLQLSIALLCFIAAGRSQKFAPFPPSRPVIFSPLPVDSAPDQDRQCIYTVSYPIVMKSESSNMICTLVKCKEEVTININVQYYAQTIQNVNTVGSEYYGCNEVKVPYVNKTELALVTVRLVGNNTDIRDQKQVAFDTVRKACVFQKEKPINDLGDTVNLRCMCYDEHMKPVFIRFTRAVLRAPNNAIIALKKNPPTENGICTLSFETTPNMQSGYYTVEVADEGGETHTAYVQIQEVILPRYESRITCPNTLSVMDGTLRINGSANYPQGGVFKGTVVIECTRSVINYGLQGNCYKHLQDISINMTQTLDDEGKFEAKIDLLPFKMENSAYQGYMQCQVTTKEEGTGVLDSQSCFMGITDRLAIISLDYDTIGQCYNNMDVHVSARLTDEKGQPMENKTLTIRIDGTIFREVNTDGDGRATCIIPTSDIKIAPNVTMTVTYEATDQCYGQDKYSTQVQPHPYAETLLSHCYTESDSHVRIRKPPPASCNQLVKIQVDYKITEKGVEKGQDIVHLLFLVKTQALVIKHQEIKEIDLKAGREGSVNMEFTVDYNVAGNSEFMVIMPLRTEIISDSMTLSVDPCFQNEVTLSLNPAVVAPGADVTRTITATPGSVCALSIIDDKFKLLGYYDELNPESILQRWQIYTYGYNYGEYNFDEAPPSCVSPNTLIYCGGKFGTQYIPPPRDDTYRKLMNAKIVVVSNLNTHAPVMCDSNSNDSPGRPVPMFEKAFASDASRLSGAGGSAGSSAIVTIRNNDMNAFAFDVVNIGSNGQATDSVKTPLGITKWSGKGVCLSNDTGLGITMEPATFTTLLDFYTDFAMPGYLIRGESGYAVITAVNNMDGYCVEAKPGIEDSEDFTYEFTEGNGTKCICSQKRASWTVKITPKKTGKLRIDVSTETIKISKACADANDESKAPRKDILQENISVKPFGVLTSSSYNYFLKGGSDPRTITLVEPKNYVPDSLTLTMSTIGNPLDLALRNIDNLFTQPGGCCQQQMDKLMTIWALTEYAKASNQLEDKLDKKTKRMSQQLYMEVTSTCRGYSGEYNLFPNSYKPSIWLTLQAMEVTYKMLPSAEYVDESNLDASLNYLAQQQDPQTGCFAADGGSPFYQNDKNDSIFLTARAACVFYGMKEKHSLAIPLLESAKRCIANENIGNMSLPTRAMLFFQSAVTSNLEMYNTLYDQFMETAKTTNDGSSWSAEDEPINRFSYLPRPPLSSLLSTSYVLSGILKNPDITDEIIDFASSIVTYLCHQMDGSGGFQYSTATATALTGVAEFYYTLKSPGNSQQDLQVVVSEDNGELFSATINKENESVLQSVVVQNAKFGDLRVSTTGGGSAFFQVTANSYTGPTPGENVGYSLSVSVDTSNCIGGVSTRVPVTISCSYVGQNEKSGTSVIYWYPMSGYIIDQAKLWQLKNQNVIQDVKPDGNGYRIYIQDLTDQPVEIRADLFINGRVPVPEPAIVYMQSLESAYSASAKYDIKCENKQPETTE